MPDKYINPFTDFGFKKLFGEEANKDLLIDFLNQLLPEQGTITQLTYLKNEQLGTTEADRKAIFDLYCQNDRGEKFIVELQKAKQKFFKDRSLYYATFAVQEQAQSGDWDYRLKPVYTISVMDFQFDETAPDQFLHDVRLIEVATGEVFNDKLRFIYLEMPKFKKTEDELITRFDKWMYVIKNLGRLDRIPVRFQERIFEKLFSVAALANFNRNEQQAYQDSLKYYRDLKNAMDTMLEEGREEGRQIGLEEGRAEGELQAKQQIARQMKQLGLPTDQITTITGLSPDEIAQL
ncbi:Rpn family recombination-promoting nuclease/putative transposase [Spirosoma montaniterrae]|uniref:Transposase n=1 Tax=Spirosoma montaniterrae TaxID=1178516 RepID=A0A1P9WSW7_9BACT|nr:Rpn family recombination-promoting nuclease/putative transposase [Spirosoma montaniterrae]AQG78452.1 hypothetical protein AWR27_03320 [Spirosoma montaniterrae]